MNKNKLNPANLFAIVGVAILILVSVWSGYQIIKYAPRAISSISIFDFLKTEPTIFLKTDNLTLENDKEITLTWEIKGKLDGGVVSFLYQCTDGVVLKVYDDVNKTYRTLPCETPYNMPLSTKSLKIKLAQSNEDVSLPIAIVYTTQNAKKYKNIVNIGIKSTTNQQQVNQTNTGATNNSNIHTDSSTKTNQAPEKEGTVIRNTTHSASTSKADKTNTKVRTKNTNKCISKKFGTPDLSIYNIKVGTIVNGIFVQKNIFSESETLVVKFTVSNNGTKTSPIWYFDMLSPAKDKYVYSSKAQPQIPPCSGRYYTIKIQGLRKGEHEILIHVDPNNFIKELNEANNKAKAYIKVY